MTSQYVPPQDLAEKCAIAAWSEAHPGSPAVKWFGVSHTIKEDYRNIAIAVLITAHRYESEASSVAQLQQDVRRLDAMRDRDTEREAEFQAARREAHEAESTHMNEPDSDRNWRTRTMVAETELAGVKSLFSDAHLGFESQTVFGLVSELWANRNSIAEDLELMEDKAKKEAQARDLAEAVSNSSLARIEALNFDLSTVRRRRDAAILSLDELKRELEETRVRAENLAQKLEAEKAMRIEAENNATEWSNKLIEKDYREHKLAQPLVDEALRQRDEALIESKKLKDDVVHYSEAFMARTVEASKMAVQLYDVRKIVARAHAQHDDASLYEIDKVLGTVPPTTESSRTATAAIRLAKLRAEGWSVAVHNDYKMKGESRTFWLLTHSSGRWIKGEGETDDEALQLALTPEERGIVLMKADTARMVVERAEKQGTWCPDGTWVCNCDPEPDGNVCFIGEMYCNDCKTRRPDGPPNRGKWFRDAPGWSCGDGCGCAHEPNIPSCGCGTIRPDEPAPNAKLEWNASTGGSYARTNDLALSVYRHGDGPGFMWKAAHQKWQANGVCGTIDDAKRGAEEFAALVGGK